MTCAQSPVYKFVRGYEKNESNPGILVTHNKARYTYHKCTNIEYLVFDDIFVIKDNFKFLFDDNKYKISNYRVERFILYSREEIGMSSFK